MRIVDLRQLDSRQLAPLLAEEAQYWREELQWDYRASLDLIRRFVDAKSLAGYAALDDGEPLGYAFYVVEDHKGLLGGLYVSPRGQPEALADQLLSNVLATLRGIPRIERIEAQLVPFGCQFDQVLAGHGFRLYPRHFLLLRLDRPASASPPPEHSASGMLLEPWNDRYFSPCARLIQLAYANHTDAQINDQYRSEAGALKFLKNIILLPGCGWFQPHASFVLRLPYAQELTGVVLTSAVAPGVAHTTQLCVLPGYQGHGLGRRLMDATIAALRSRGYQALSLTVTGANERAMRLYRSLGFAPIKTFTAAVWQAGAEQALSSANARATAPSVRP